MPPSPWRCLAEFVDTPRAATGRHDMYSASVIRWYAATCLLLGVASVALAIEPPLTDVAFDPLGNSVVATSQSGLQVYSWPNLKRQRTVETSASNLHCVTFSPSGKRLAVGGGDPSEQGSVELFSWPALESTAIDRRREDSVLAVAWRDATRLVTSGLDREIKMSSLDSDEPPRSFKGHSRGVGDICLLQEGKTLVSAGHDHSVRVWDVESSQLVRSLNQHTERVRAAALRPAVTGLPMVATAAADRTIRFWQPTIGRQVRYVRLEAEPLDIAWFQDGSRVVAACVDGRIRAIDPEEAKVTQNLPAIAGWAYAIAVHPSDGSVVVGGVNGQIRRILVDCQVRVY